MKKIKILYLYPNEMNIYGDIGNVLTLRRRLEWRGYDPEVIYHHPGKTFSYDADIVVGGGGQDSGQIKVCEDLQKIGGSLKKLVNQNRPMLMVCGMYQLFGRRFVTQTGDELTGIEVFDAETRGTSTRLIGNVVLESEFGKIIGYENHSGQTYLGHKQKPFGKVIKGSGNNASDGHEGAIYMNVYGTYLHGSLLPKNPAFADHLLKIAIENRYGKCHLKPLDESLTDQARLIAENRPR